MPGETDGPAPEEGVASWDPSHELGTPLTILMLDLALIERCLDDASAVSEHSSLVAAIRSLQLDASAAADRMQRGLKQMRRANRGQPRGRPTSASNGDTGKETMGDRRYDRAWNEWDAAIERGHAEQSILADAESATLVALLAARMGEGRPVERNIIATALLNRLDRHSEHAPSNRAIWDRIMTSARLSREGRERADVTRALAAVFYTAPGARAESSEDSNRVAPAT